MDDPEPFLRPTHAVESDHPRIADLAREIVAGATDREERARRLFLHVRDGIRYSIYNPFWLRVHYLASGILERGHGYCVQKAVVLCALARAAGIPARLRFCDIINHRVPVTSWR
jgi:transglutaminase-like putative cysteine protease